MIVEKIILDNEKSDNFPAGLRVLAVDDDPICLKLLETLLRKCQYQVTTTSQARMALNMLRENKDRFDLVISDVHMPDMDGFKLLELVGLEMDLPVIMLSANSDPKLVMKGVTHGACDYLVKPIRIEELRNIWQHVLRRKKFDSKNQNASTDQVNAQPGDGEGHVSPTTGDTDPHGRFNRKRKDEEDDEEDDGPGRLGNATLSPYATSGILGRLNSPVNMNLRNLTQSSLLQPTHSPNLSNLIGKTHPVLSSSSQNPSLFQGIPSSLDLDQIPQKGTLNFNGMDDSRIFAAANTFTDSGAAFGGSSNVFNSTGNNPMMFVGGFGKPSSNNMTSFNSESFNTGITCSSNLLDPGKCNETWQNIIESPKMQPNSLLSANPFHPQLPLSGRIDKNSSNGSYSQNKPVVASSVPLQDSRERSCQDLVVSDAQEMNQTTNNIWGEQKQNYRHIHSAFGSLNSQRPENGIGPPLNQSLDHNSGIFDQKMDVFVNGRSSVGVLSLVQQNESDKSPMEPRARSNENFLLEQPKLLGGFVHQSCDSLDDLIMNAMIKREQDDTTSNCDFVFDDYAFGQAYCVVAVESVGRQIPIAFLERVKEDFTKKYAGGKAATAVANSLNKEFGPKMKEQMQYCVNHPEEISKLAKVKAQVSEVKGVMMENIEKVLDRGEKIELLVDKTENLRSQAQDFRTQGTKMRRKMWLQNMKIKLIVLGIIIALILIIVLSVCGGFKCH